MAVLRAICKRQSRASALYRPQIDPTGTDLQPAASGLPCRYGLPLNRSTPSSKIRSTRNLRSVRLSSGVMTPARS
jgi:hypothetical protein